MSKAIDFFIWIDTEFLNIYQRISDFSHNWLGMGNFELGRQSIYIFSISAVIWAYVDAIKKNIYSDAILTTLVTALGTWYFLKKFNEVEQSVQRGVIKGLGNPLLISPPCIVVRISILVFCISNLAAMGIKGEYFFPFMVITSFVSIFYFAACNPLPPGKSKVKQWLESFRRTNATHPVAT